MSDMDTMFKVLNEYTQHHLSEGIIGLVENKYRPRKYHNLDHINFCLNQLDKFSGLTDDEKMILRLAIVFHDIETSETDSAQLATVLLRFTLKEEILSKPSTSIIGMIDLVISGTNHLNYHNYKMNLVEDELKLTDIMNDIDLAILGQNTERFSQYDESIAREYLKPHSDFLDFTRARLNVLSHFYNLPNIFNTSMFSAKFETKAKANLQFRIKLYGAILDLLRSGFAFAGVDQYVNALNMFIPPKA